MIWIEFFSQTLASYVMLRVHRVEVIFWWFKVLGNLQGAHCEYQKALDGHKSDSYAHWHTKLWTDQDDLWRGQPVVEIFLER